jgi:broad specificity phosphatase PhoE
VTRLLLARHGETDWNREQRFQGHADPPLNQTGRAQAVDLSVALAAEPLAAVYTSPLRRALETAEIVAAAHGQEPVTVDALMEVDVGAWQGLTRADIEERYPDQFARWLDHVDGFGFTDGESYEELGARVIPALLGLAAIHPGERILAVTHGGPIRTALARVDSLSYAEARTAGPTIVNVFVVELAVEDEILRRID